MLLLFILLGTAAWELLFRHDSTEIVIQASDGTANFDAVTAASYGSRMADLAETTIVSILTIGGALIGLNWFTSHRNYQDEMRRFASERESANKQLAEAISRVELKLAPLRSELIEVRTDQENHYQSLSEALAATAFPTSLQPMDPL
jgi:hypothetical protein